MDKKRLNSLINKIKSREYDGMVLTQVNNIGYVSNYFPTSFALCVLKEDPVIFISPMDMELAKKTSSINIKEFKSFSDLKNFFKKENMKNIAIESSLPTGYYKKIEGKWNLNIEEFLETERMIKSPEEISKLNEALIISHDSFKELDVRNKQEKGFSEWETAYELGFLLRKNGAQKESFETIIATGSNSSLPHAKTENKKLETPILMDWGCKYQGFCSDNSRTIVYTEKQEEIFNIVLEAYNKAISTIKPDIKVCEIDNVARSVIEDYGYGNNFVHSTGHSLGLDIHEKPIISKKDETILENNMIITIEPGIYLGGKFGVRIEDMILVDGKGKIMGNLPFMID